MKVLTGLAPGVAAASVALGLAAFGAPAALASPASTALASTALAGTARFGDEFSVGAGGTLAKIGSATVPGGAGGEGIAAS